MDNRVKGMIAGFLSIFAMKSNPKEYSFTLSGSGTFGGRYSPGRWKRSSRTAPFSKRRTAKAKRKRIIAKKSRRRNRAK